MKNILQAVTRLDEDGNCQSVPADRKHSNKFLHIDRFSNLVGNFFSNFWNQVIDPARFRLFSMKRAEFDTPENKQAMKDILDKKETDAVAEFLKKYEIKQRGLKEKNQTDQKNDTKMAKATNTQAQQGSQAGASEERTPRFNESLINWEELKKFGLSRDMLAAKGLLQEMLSGYKTSQLIPIIMNFGSAVLRTDARLSFQQSVGGPAVLSIHGVRKEPDFNRPYFGHVFSDEDKKNLKETGNMGRVVDLNLRGENIPSFIIMDRLTHELLAAKAENVYIDRNIKGIELTDSQMQDLREGKALYLEGMTSSKGKDFDATIQVSAERRGVEFMFNNDKLFNRTTLGGVNLSPEQIDDLNAGKAILVEDMQTKAGATTSSFVKLDEATGRLLFFSFNPDSPEGAREIIIPKEISGAPLTYDDRVQLSEGKTIFVENMIDKQGQEFSSFVKLDLETGRWQFATTIDGFSERPEFKIPKELLGVKLTGKQYGALQEGKAVFVEGIKGFDGKVISQWAKANLNTGLINYYNDNPDQKKDVSQRNVFVVNRQKQETDQESKKVNKRSSGPKL